MNTVRATSACSLLTIFGIVSMTGFCGCGKGTTQSSPNLPQTQIMGVTLGLPLSEYRVLKGPAGDGEYTIDPTMFPRPGAMGKYKWSYYAYVDSEKRVYKITCKARESDANIRERDSYTLKNAVETVYPNIVSEDTSYYGRMEHEITITDAKDGYQVWIHRIVRLGTDALSETTYDIKIDIVHKDTESRLDKLESQRSREEVLKKNAGF